MILAAVFGVLAALALLLNLWQAWAGLRFPLHRRAPNVAPTPAVSLLKPLKGCEPATAACLRSWLDQDYAGPVQVLFGVASAQDPVCAVVQELIRDQPGCHAELLICNEALATNAKVSTLIQLQRRARHDLLLVSDADVQVPRDLLANAVLPLRDPAVGLVNCLYLSANPRTLAARWEAVAVNADFWSQALQSQSLWPVDFALGAVMLTRRAQLEDIGGFEALADYLADDYQLGHLIARRGGRVVFCPIVVECWEPSGNWCQTWRHQLRWARTIRFCKPWPYALSLLGNATLWPLLWAATRLTLPIAFLAAVIVSLRIASAGLLQMRLTRSAAHWRYFWLAPVKDLLQVALWLCALAGRHVLWRGDRYRLEPGGKIVKV